MIPYSRHLSKPCNPCVLVIEAAPFFNSPRVEIDPMWIGDSLSAWPAKTFMSIGALFHTHICPDAVIGLEEKEGLAWPADLKLFKHYFSWGSEKEGSNESKEKSTLCPCPSKDHCHLTNWIWTNIDATCPLVDRENRKKSLSLVTRVHVRTMLLKEESATNTIFKRAAAERDRIRFN